MSGRNPSGERSELEVIEQFKYKLDYWKFFVPFEVVVITKDNHLYKLFLNTRDQEFEQHVEIFCQSLQADRVEFAKTKAIYFNHVFLEN